MPHTTRPRTRPKTFDGEKTLRRILIVLIIVVLFVIGISHGMAHLPFSNTPAWIKSLFTKNWHGTIAWIKIRHTIVVILIGGFLSLLLIKCDKRNAQIDAVFIGFLSVLYCVIYKWVLCRIYHLPFGGPSLFTWVEVTDYLAIGLAIPAIVAVIQKFLKWPTKPPPNKGLVLDAANDAAPHTP